MAIYLDVEILDWFQDEHIAKLPRWRQYAELRFGLATTYAESNGYKTWWADELEDLYYFLVSSDGPVVTWNGDEFDLPYLIVQAIRLGATTDPWHEIPESLDLMTLIRRESKRMTGKERWYKLDTIAMANLGRGKIGHGDEAAAWLRSGDPVLLRQAADYCQDDVKLLVDLHDLLLAGHGLICPERIDRKEYKALEIGLVTP